MFQRRSSFPAPPLPSTRPRSSPWSAQAVTPVPASPRRPRLTHLRAYSGSTDRSVLLHTRLGFADRGVLLRAHFGCTDRGVLPRAYLGFADHGVLLRAYFGFADHDVLLRARLDCGDRGLLLRVCLGYACMLGTRRTSGGGICSGVSSGILLASQVASSLASRMVRSAPASAWTSPSCLSRSGIGSTGCLTRRWTRSAGFSPTPAFVVHGASHHGNVVTSPYFSTG